jgi:elongation factor P
MASPTDIRKGKVLIHGGVPHIVTEMQHRTQGRQAGFVQVTMRNVQTGSSTVAKIRTTENVEFGFIERKKLEFSYQDGTCFHFTHLETFEDNELAANLVEDVRLFLVENESYDVLFVNGKSIGVELPSTVTMQVKESADGIRGDSASNVQKPAILSTGLIVQVPLFIKQGDFIKVSTEKRCYLGRA